MDNRSLFNEHNILPPIETAWYTYGVLMDGFFTLVDDLQT